MRSIKILGLAVLAGITTAVGNHYLTPKIIAFFDKKSSSTK